jgi:hypothetical protein
MGFKTKTKKKANKNGAQPPLHEKAAVTENGLLFVVL